MGPVTFICEMNSFVPLSPKERGLRSSFKNITKINFDLLDFKKPFLLTRLPCWVPASSAKLINRSPAAFEEPFFKLITFLDFVSIKLFKSQSMYL